MNGTVTMRDRTVEVRGSCERCGEPWTVVVPADGWHRWRSTTTTVDEAFPGLGDEAWWALVESICPPCHKEMAEADWDGNPEVLGGDARRTL